MRRARLGFVMLAAATSLVVVGLSSGAAGRAEAWKPRGRPLLGVNFIQWQYNLPYCWGMHVIFDYGNWYTRSVVVEPALHAMHASGVEALRLQVPHAHAASGFPIDSSSGRLVEPYRTNLIRFLRDIRDAGIERVTVAFMPWASNDPTGMFPGGNTYDPALFEENWSFIRDVVPLVKRYGPASTGIDLINEGAPIWWQQPALGSYLTRMYRNYVDAFGNRDVTVSTITKAEESQHSTADGRERLQNLIDALRASGRPLPTWFDVHPSWGKEALADLRASDAVLKANGLSQPLVVGEVIYENAEAANAVAEFVRTSSRPVLEVMQWPLYTLDWIIPPPGGTWQHATQPKCPTPPFRVDEYAKALRGDAPPRALTAKITPNGRLTLRDPSGHPATVVVRGRYTLRVRDTSARYAFRLSHGRTIDAQTGIRYRGTRTLAIRLRADRSEYLIRVIGPHGRRQPLTVMFPGG